MITWEYIAGFFDGEGSITHQREHNWRISITNNHYGVLQDIQDFLECFGIVSAIVYKQPSKAYPDSHGYALRLGAKQSVLTFMHYIIPHSIVKKEDLLIARASVLQSRDVKRPTEENYEEVRRLLTEGYSYNEIWDITGIHYSFGTLTKLCEELELPSRCTARRGMLK